MPVVRLRVEKRTPLAPCSYSDPDRPGRPPRVLPVLRVMADVRVVPPPGRPGVRPYTGAGLLDTGADLSLADPDFWKGLSDRGLAEDIPSSGGTLLAGGAASPFRLGRLWIQVYQNRLPPKRSVVLPAVPVLVRVVTDPDPLVETYKLILGLYRGVLDGRKLLRRRVPYRPVPDDRNGNLDCGRRYRQQWYLAAPGPAAATSSPASG